MTRVLMLTEGTYPFVDGGVSTWCGQIIVGLPEIEFTVYSITGDVQARQRYTLPQSARLVQVPLWGVEHPAEWGLDSGGVVETIRRRRRTRGPVARRFAEMLTGLLADMERPEDDPLGAGRRLLEMHRYFLAHDFVAALRAPEAWEAFRSAAAGARWAEGATGTDLTTCLRWLRALLMPLALPVPEADLSHATISGLAALPGVLAKIERGTPLLITEHGVYLRERYLALSTHTDIPAVQRSFLLALAELTASVAYAHADAVAPVCRYNAVWERRLGASDDLIDHIWNGVDPTLFVPRPKPPERRGRPTAVAAARVFPLKDIETMIRAAAHARERIPDVLFLLYGSLSADPPYVEKCRRLVADLGLEDTFVFAGLAPNPTEIFNQGDIGVLSSVSEAFPYTILEAMACGRPSAATDVGGVGELLEGTVPPRDPAALGQACVDLLADPRRRAELGRRARERLLAHFRVSLTIDRYRELYGRLIGVPT
ncbi:MAG: polysaccharide biosynthesis protein PelF [Miltoncostaeaceae bacterium]|jgi:glycosyltransferase involved in cell wall biosynthesis|nr:polysaccharide biosynthesis protein PelF [Miltoncostaeaceae bacterium]